MITHMQIVRALNTLRQGAVWNLRGDSLEGLEWLDELQTRPSDAEIESWIEGKL